MHAGGTAYELKLLVTRGRNSHHAAIELGYGLALGGPVTQKRVKIH
jgi:hypothetical protein